MASDIWLRTILIVKKETRCRHIGYSFRLAARVLYMHHPTDRITHTTASRGALAGTRIAQWGVWVRGIPLDAGEMEIKQVFRELPFGM